MLTLLQVRVRRPEGHKGRVGQAAARARRAGASSERGGLDAIYSAAWLERSYPGAALTQPDLDVSIRTVESCEPFDARLLPVLWSSIREGLCSLAVVKHTVSYVARFADRLALGSSASAMRMLTPYFSCIKVPASPSAACTEPRQHVLSERTPTEHHALWTDATANMLRLATEGFYPGLQDTVLEKFRDMVETLDRSACTALQQRLVPVTRHWSHIRPGWLRRSRTRRSGQCVRRICS